MIFEFLAGVDQLICIIDYMWGEEDDQFVPRLGVALVAKKEAKNRNPVEIRNARTGDANALLNDAADGDSVPVLHGELGGDGAAGERRRLNGAGTRCHRRAHFLVDHHGDDSAGTHARQDLQRGSGVAIGNTVGKETVAALLDPGRGSGC